MIPLPPFRTQMTTEKRSVSRIFLQFFSRLADLDIEIGTGDPEGVVEANQSKLYMDSAGTVGAILYIKRDADISGDSTKGWVLV